MSVWSYRADVRDSESSLIGYQVKATDGDIGEIESETLDVEANRLVVDTGFWIFGTKRIIPAGMVARVDHDSETVHIDMTKDQVKNSPEYIDVTDTDFDRSLHGSYYDSLRGL